jgi:hypothetical protein
MMASPRRKWRLETQPGSTTYERRRGRTTGPPPKMIVPVRYMLAKRSRASGGSLMTPRATRMPMKAAMGSGKHLQIPRYRSHRNCAPKKRTTITIPILMRIAWSEVFSLPAGCAERRPQDGLTLATQQRHFSSECYPGPPPSPQAAHYQPHQSPPPHHLDCLFSFLFNFALTLPTFWLIQPSQMTVARLPSSMSSGKYHNALQQRPAHAPRITRIRVGLSLIAFSASCTAASAMMPTVEAFRPERRA